MSEWSFKNYWREKGSVINRRRKERYSRDKTYREEMKERARQYYFDKYRANRPPVDRMEVMGEDGKDYVTIGRVAELIRRKPGTIRDYFRDGVLPRVMYYDKRGARLFSRGQLRLLQRVFNDFDKKNIKKLSDLKQILESEGWYVQ